MAEKASFISRFFYKILEIMGAAVATAVSGYLVAHLGGFGFLPPHTQAPTPPAVAVVPSERPVPKSVPATPPASQPATAPQSTQSAAAPASPDAGDHRPAQSQPDATGSAPQPARKGSTAKAAPPPRKSGKPETAATEASRPRETTDAKTTDAKTTEAKAIEAKAREAEAKSRETEAKAREAEDKESVEARVRAALANVDANRPAPADVPPRRGDNQGGPAQPRSVETSPNTTAAVAPRPLDPPPTPIGPPAQPRSADLGSPTVQPAAIQSPAAQPAPAAPLQVAPVQPTPPQQPDALTTVEIKSRPVATIDTAPAPEAAPPQQQQEERGVLSVFKHILPDFHRPASVDETPRPPAPVGE